MALDISFEDNNVFNVQLRGGSQVSLDPRIGNLSDLTTTDQDTVVAAINEVDANCNTNTTNIATNTSAIGTLANLTTTDKTNLVAAVNELGNDIDSFAWTLAGTASGGNTVTYPSTAKELYVSVYCYGQIHSVYLMPDVVSATKIGLGGYYYSSSDYGTINCDWNTTNHTINIRNAIYAGSNQKSSSTLYVYYR